MGSPDAGSAVSSSPTPVTGPTGRQMASAIAWTAMAKWSSQVVSWTSLFLTIRLLTPRDFGLFGLGTTYLGLVTFITEFGVGTAILNLRDLTRSQIAQLNTLSIVLGFAGVAVSAAVAYPLGGFFQMPELPAIIAALSLNFIILSFRSIPQALLQKDLQFRVVSVSEALQAIAQALGSVGFAYMGAGYWSLVGGALLGALVSTIVPLLYRPCGFQIPQRSAVGQALSFSWRIVVTRIAWYLYSNADFAVAGRVLGAAQLGAYNVAWNFANMPGEKVITLVLRVTPAFFAAKQKDLPGLRRYLLVLTDGLCTVMFPVVAGLALVAPDFIRLMFGAKWEASIIPLQLLAVYALLRSVVTLLPQALTAVGDLKFSMWVTIATLVVLPPSFYYASYWGVVGIAAVWVVVYPLFTIPLYIRTFRQLDMRPSEYFRVIEPALAGSVFMTAVVIALKWAWPEEVSVITRLICEVTAGVTAYALILLTFYRPRVQSSIDMIRRLKGKAA